MQASLCERTLTNRVIPLAHTDEGGGNKSLRLWIVFIYTGRITVDYQGESAVAVCVEGVPVHENNVVTLLSVT